MVRKVIIPTVFLIGMLIFLYPIVSNWFSTQTHYKVMGKHNEQLAQMSEEEKIAERKRAEQYNADLHEMTLPIEDPFSKNAEESVVTGYFNVLDIGNTMGTIAIPRINVELPIYHGIGEKVLQQGIGHMSNSSFPVGGKGTHTALTGHRGLPSSKLFRDLDKVEIGDVFLIYSLDDVLAYEVNEIEIVLPNETDSLQIEENKDLATLITCEPYMINTHRLLVRGERIPYEPQMASTMTPMKEIGKIASWQYSTIAGIIIVFLVGTMITVLRRWKRLKE